MMNSEIKKIVNAVKSGKSSARAEVEKSINLAKESENLHALLELLEDYALDRADEIDARIAKGEDVGRLAGVPYVAKDNFLTKVGHTTAAAKILENFESPIDATAIERLDAEGAILIGKANLDAFAHGGSTENSAFGPTHNVADFERVAGGSSGGSAAIVAAGVVPFALGSDTGGSIRQPASFNGVVGLKPTYGMISRYGVVAMASSTDVVGPLTRTVKDAEIVSEILAGPDKKDSTVHKDFFNVFDTLTGEINPNNLRVIEREIVGPAIISSDSRVLLGGNRKGGVYENYLIVPGGGVEEGETLIDALKRETMEEVGIDISDAKIEKVNRKMTGSAEKNLRETGERVWVNMNFNNYIIKINKPAAEIKMKTEDDFSWAKWYTAEDLKSEHMNLSTERFLMNIGFIPEKLAEKKPFKIGLIREFIGDGVDPGVVARTREFVAKLEAAGHVVEEVDLPMAKYSLAVYYIVVPAEVSSNLARYDGVRYGVRSDSAKTLDEVFGQSRDRGFMPENKRRVMIGSYVLSSGYFDAYYLQAQKARTLLINEFDKLFTEYDFLIGPTAPTPAFKLGENTADPIKMYLADAMTVPPSLAGLPALSLPNGNSESGLPIGVQIIGQQKDDARLLSLAKSMEEK